MSRVRDARLRAVPWLRRVGVALVLVVVVEYVVLPQLVGAGNDVALLGSARPVYLVLALVLEVVSLGCFTLLTRATLPVTDPLPFWTLLRVDLTGYGVSHVVPGGGATAAAFRYRLLTRAGLGGDDAFAGAMVQTAAALVALVGVFAAGVALSLQATTGQPSSRTAGLVALVLLTAVAAGVVLMTVRRSVSLAWLHRLLAPLPATHASSLEDAVTVLTDRVVLLTHDRTLLSRTVGWAATNWLLDAACLWCCLRAYGYTPGIGALLAMYGVVNLLAMLPLTPGGLGIVEGILVPSLITVGATPAVALLGVLTWRLAQYWLPIPVALLTYVSLRLGPLRRVRVSHHTSAPAGPSPAHRKASP